MSDILASSSLADAVDEMDVLAITEGRASFDEEARTLSNGQIEPDLQPTETDNKFQKAIAAWKGNHRVWKALILHTTKSLDRGRPFKSNFET